MLSEIRSNGNIQIRLTGQSPIEVLVIREIVEAVSKGQTVDVGPAYNDNSTLVIALANTAVKGG